MAWKRWSTQIFISYIKTLNYNISSKTPTRRESCVMVEIDRTERDARLGNVRLISVGLSLRTAGNSKRFSGKLFVCAFAKSRDENEDNFGQIKSFASLLLVDFSVTNSCKLGIFLFAIYKWKLYNMISFLINATLLFNFHYKINITLCFVIL